MRPSAWALLSLVFLLSLFALTWADAEYYSLTRIDARAAWYVIGSGVVGPMGHELIPLDPRRGRGISVL